MNLLAAFKKPALDAQAMGPARAALNAHMAAITALVDRRNALAAKQTATGQDVQASDWLASDIAKRQAAIDQVEADARYGDQPAPSLTEERTALAAAKDRQERIASVSRAAQIAHRRYAADMADLARRTQELNAQVPRLLHAAVYESIADFAAEFEAAEAQLRAIHRKVFIAATAADQVSLAHKFGIWTASQLYGELRITRPQHQAFEPISTDPTLPGITPTEKITAGNALAAEHARIEEELRSMGPDAERYANQVLTGAAGA